MTKLFKLQLVVGVDYSVAERIFRNGQPQEVDEELFNYLKDNAQFQVVPVESESADEEIEDLEETDEPEETDEEVEEVVAKPKRKRNRKKQA